MTDLGKGATGAKPGDEDALHARGPSSTTGAPSAARKQLHWLEEMERIEQEVFPDARPRSEVVVPAMCEKCGVHVGQGQCPHGSVRCSGDGRRMSRTPSAATVEGSPISRPGGEWVLVERDVPRYPHDWRLIFRRGDELLEVYVPEEVWHAFDR